MAGAVRRVGLAVEPPGSAHLRPAWPPANPPTRPTSPLQTATATVTLGWVRTSKRVQIDAAEHRTGSADHVRRWNLLRHGGKPDVTFPRDRRAPKEEGGPG